MTDALQEDGCVDCVDLDQETAVGNIPQRWLMWKLEHTRGLKKHLLRVKDWLCERLTDEDSKTDVWEKGKNKWSPVGLNVNATYHNGYDLHKRYGRWVSYANLVSLHMAQS